MDNLNIEDELNISELIYCLTQDIQDYLMHEEDTNLQCFADILDEINNHETITNKDTVKLIGIMSYLALNGFSQFSEDTKTLLEEINETK